jgi:hypothetical protein
MLDNENNDDTISHLDMTGCGWVCDRRFGYELMQRTLTTHTLNLLTAFQLLV